MRRHRKTPKYTREILTLLKECAAQRELITYGEIERKAGLIARAVPGPLRFIEDEVCRPYGRPWLSALVVNKRTRRPGQAFAPEGQSVTPDNYQWWRELVQCVYNFDWSEVEIGESGQGH